MPAAEADGSAPASQWVAPVAPADVADGELAPLIDLQAGYVLRGVGRLPKQGERSPWRLHQNYLRDFALLRAGRITDDVRFGRRGERVGRAVERRVGAYPLGPRGRLRSSTVAGRSVRYRVTGSGAPILLLHGIGQSLDDWTEQHERLSARHTVYSVDLPGFGYSERRPGAATLAKLAGDPAGLPRRGRRERCDPRRRQLPRRGRGHDVRVAVARAGVGARAGRQRGVRLGGRRSCCGCSPSGRSAPAACAPNPKNSRRTVESVFYDKSVRDGRAGRALVRAGAAARARPNDPRGRA